MDSQSLFLLISLCFLSIYLLFIRTRNRRNQDNVKPYPVLGHLPEFLKNRHRFHDWMTDLLAATPTNTLVFRRPGNDRGIVTANPANVEHMLKSNFDNFPKGRRFRSILHDFLGNGIFNSDGHLWKVQRKTASFEFNNRSLRNFVVENVQQETSARLLPLLQKCADNERVIDMQDVLERYAFDNVCKVAFNEDPACLAADELSGFADAFRDAAEVSAGRFRYAVPGFWKIKKMLGIGSERRLKESISIVHDFALQIIRSRMKERRIASKPQADDLLSRFIAVEEFSEESLRDIVISFLLAGRETTHSLILLLYSLILLLYSFSINRTQQLINL